MAKKIIVISGAHAGYRRAGVKLNQGRNEFDESWFSAQQLAQLKADEKLSVSEVEDKPDSSTDTSGKLDANPSPTGVTGKSKAKAE
ncbi:Rho termination factor domain protein [Catenovulum agarivorans DS-2]|uniref:Rho termination factor domain protein n=1 Tax=Catenovulum agarivorans DS-2 TaxID=1328313 RepID=W7QAL9_9ALTE|nr:HI1506-related protein [Catenovulum agarivorans]EWH09859.1 Rho termination factor domain protein [Catenovulum agarivorans DS-2]